MPVYEKIKKNQRFGKWTVLEYAKTDCRGDHLIKCKCDCGSLRNVSYQNLKRESSLAKEFALSTSTICRIILNQI